ncbi:MAG: acetylxylan esterase [Planctomycetota bacterium]|nr:acetylxylan esterase [Planctomycetota bacterium]MDA0918197.1 acetylxylan esterase [Planctomycetota bacterium]
MAMRIVLIILLTMTTSSAETVGEDLNCLTEAERADSKLYSHLQQEAYKALVRRAEAYEELKTPEQIEAYQQKLRRFMTEQLGGFPEKTPLNARTVGTIDADGYRIEKVIFDSQPQHHITANLYLPNLPKTDGPVPAIAVSSGHSRTAKTADYNQRFGIMMAKHGMAALCFDPIGQGERSQILTAEGHPQHNGTTTEHFLMGVGSTLVGRNTARYRVWDAMRAIDYLVSRPEVDASKIGFTGCSGGGTLTSYVMALDDRVACAAPACYLTTFRHLVETIGPQDAEQNIFGQLAFGLDHPDYVLMRAPRPTLISSTTGDYFNIEGAWQNYRQAKRVYGRLGFPERVDLVEVEGRHGVHPQNLATITHWFQRWLLGRDKPVSAVELPTLSEAELLCTKSGQVLTEFSDELSVFDLNAAHESELAASRVARWRGSDDAKQDSLVRTAIGVRPDAELKPPKFEDVSRVKRENYHIDKLILRTDSGIPLPGLTFHPPSPVDDAYLYLHEDGKLGDSEADGPIEDLISEGYAVVTVDLRGQGETGTGNRDATLTDWKTFYLNYLLGKSLVGLRVEDALAAADFVAFYQKKRDSPRKVHLAGVGHAGIVALHAAALNPDLFASVTLKKTPRSWASVVRLKSPAGHLDSTVHGALEVYDLPDLVRLAGKDKVRFED